MKTSFSIFCGIFFSAISLVAQKDTAFWFVAPEVSKSISNYDRPIFLKFSTYDAAAVVTVTQPANPAFPAQTLNIGAGVTGELDLTNYIDMIESKPANQVLNYGLYITATSPISAYYEILGLCVCNPEICSLKGRHALGNTFYVPFQNYLANGNATDPAKGAFDIVATEPNTQITITPTANLVGHPANVSFSITLDKGETYSAVIQGTSAASHPSGTKVVADKPIAITMKDDLLNGGAYYGGSCLDIVSDQLVPVSTLGNRYAVIKGELDGTEKAFVVATVDNTAIQVNGAPAGTINEGETFTVDITGYHFIAASQPVCVLQVTGIGCETSGEFLPSLDCTGSAEVRFIRSTPEPFYLFIIASNGNQDAFTLNGSASAITPSDFTIIPGSGSEFVAAKIPFSNSIVPAGMSTLVQNSEGLFHLGFLNGDVSVTGSRFGFFSDYLIPDTINQEYNICQGDSVLIEGSYVHDAGVSYETVFFSTGCEQVLRHEVVLLNNFSSFNPVELCNGDTLYVGNHFYVNSGIYFDTLATVSACDSVIITQLTFSGGFSEFQDIHLCTGDTFYVGNHPYVNSGIYFDTLASVAACDSVVISQLTFSEPFSEFHDVHLCTGDTLYVGNHYYVNSGVYFDTLATVSACDSVIISQLTFADQFSEFQDIHLCTGDTFYIGNHYYTSSGTYFDTLISLTACDSVIVTQLTISDYSAVSQDIQLCAGDTFFIGSHYYISAGTYIDTLVSLTACDSVVTTQLTISDYFYKWHDIQLCAGDTFYIGNHYYITSGTYFDTLASLTVCDSVIVSQLTFADYFSEVQQVQLCAGDTFYIGNHYYVNSGTYFDTLASLTTCDSVIISQLTFSSNVSISQDIQLCTGDTFYIGNHYYTDAGTYKDTLVSLTGCDTLVTINLSFYEVTEDFILHADTFICEGQLIVLSSPYENTIWSNGDAGFFTDINEPDFITAIARNAQNCLVKDTATVGPCCSPDFIYFPNVFSPNDDLINDDFCPFSGSLCYTVLFRVFDRWGELIFDSEVTPTCWDGTYRGKPCPVEVYAWYALIIDDAGKTVILEGDVTLIR